MQRPEGGILAHSFARITIHVVFSTKKRRNLILKIKCKSCSPTSSGSHV